MLIRTVSKQILQISAMVFIILASYFAEASQPGVMICHDQIAPSYGNQYLVLKKSYFLTFDSRQEEENEQGSVTELDASSLPGVDFMEYTGSVPIYCKEVSVASLIAEHPALKEIILEFQSVDSQQAQEYKIIPLPASLSSAGLNTRYQVALIAGVIAYALSLWTIPAYSLYAAAVAGFACYSKPDYCRYLYAASVNVISTLWNRADQSRRRTFGGQGVTVGGPAEGSGAQVSEDDLGVMRAARIKAFSPSSD